MQIRLFRDAAPADPALAAWRCHAANVVLAAVTAVHLPAALLALLGYGVPTTPTTRALIMAAYVVMIPSAFLRRVDYRVRLLVFFVAAYVVVALSNIVSFSAPYASLGLVVHPILALVLYGPVAAHVAVFASAAILVLAPFVRLLPGVAGTLLANPDGVTHPPPVFWSYAAAVTAFLATLMVLLDRFHGFLLDALRAQRQTTITLEDEMRERQRLEREIAAIADEERRHLGHELHDGVCQQLTAALLRCQALQQSVRQGTASPAEELEPLRLLLTETIDDAHDVASGLCPLAPEPAALGLALRTLTRRMAQMAGVRCEFVARGDVRVPEPATAHHLYRIAQEALSNAARHAKAGRITVELSGSDGELLMQVEDDGTGLRPGHAAGGMGLRTMGYRARIVGGD